ncbi:MAG TPA: hypothetical protein VIP75_05245, partial [Acidothermales bacterium]
PLAGSVLGPAGGQFFFTLAVAALFIQVAPADWRLAEARLLDVVLGGVVGSIVGVLAHSHDRTVDGRLAFCGRGNHAAADATQPDPGHRLADPKFQRGQQRA